MQSTAKLRRRLKEKIGLLCQCGTGIESIAGPLTHAIRDLLECESGALFWLDADRNPQGFYHDSAPAELKELFVTELDSLFTVPGEFNVMTLTSGGEPSIGRLTGPEATARFRSEAVYANLCRPLGHHHAIDMRVDVDGTGRVLFCGWNGLNAPFGGEHVELLRPLQRLIARAVANTRQDAAWYSAETGGAQFVTDPTGERLIAIDKAAEEALKSSHLLRQRIPIAAAPREAPRFAAELTARLKAGGDASLAIAIANGRLVLRASVGRILVPEPMDAIFFALQIEEALEVRAVDRLMSLALTPLQREIALFAVQGGQRLACEAEFGVGTESLKKHLRAIYSASGAQRWTELPETLTAEL